MNQTTITAVGDMASSFVTMAYLLNRKGYKYGKTEDLDSFQSILGDLVRYIYLERTSPTTTPFAEERGSPGRTSPVLSPPGSPKFKSSPDAAENKSGSLCKTQATVSPNVTQTISGSPCGTAVIPSPNVTQTKSGSPGRTQSQDIPGSPCRTTVRTSPNVTQTKSGSPRRIQSQNIPESPCSTTGTPSPNVTLTKSGSPRRIQSQNIPESPCSTTGTPSPNVTLTKSGSPGRRQSSNICGSPGRAIVPQSPDVSQNKSGSPGRRQSPNICGSPGRAIVPPSPDVSQNKSGSPCKTQSQNIPGSPCRTTVRTSPNVTQTKSGSPRRTQSQNIPESPCSTTVTPSPNVTLTKSGSPGRRQSQNIPGSPGRAKVTPSPDVSQNKSGSPCRTTGSTLPVVTQQKYDPACASKLPRKAPGRKLPWIPSRNLQTFNRASSNPALKLPWQVGKSQSKLPVPSNLRLNENACPGTSGAKIKPPIRANLKTCPAPQSKKYTGAIPKIAISRPEQLEKANRKLAVPSNLRLNENTCPGTSGAKIKPPIQANLKTCPAPQPTKYTGAIPKIAISRPEQLEKANRELVVPSNLRLNENACPGTSGAKIKPPIQANLKTCPAPQPTKYTGAIPKIEISGHVSNTATAAAPRPEQSEKANRLDVLSKSRSLLLKLGLTYDKLMKNSEIIAEKLEKAECIASKLSEAQHTTAQLTAAQPTAAQRIADKRARAICEAQRNAQEQEDRCTGTGSTTEKAQLNAAQLTADQLTADQLIADKLIADKRARAICEAQRNAQEQEDSCTGTESTTEINAQRHAQRFAQLERAKQLGNQSKPDEPSPNVRLTHEQLLKQNKKGKHAAANRARAKRAAQRDAQGQGDRCIGTGSTTQTNAQRHAQSVRANRLEILSKPRNPLPNVRLSHEQLQEHNAKIVEQNKKDKLAAANRARARSAAQRDAQGQGNRANRLEILSKPRNPLPNVRLSHEQLQEHNAKIVEQNKKDKLAAANRARARSAAQRDAQGQGNRCTGTGSTTQTRETASNQQRQISRPNLNRTKSPNLPKKKC